MQGSGEKSERRGDLPGMRLEQNISGVDHRHTAGGMALDIGTGVIRLKGFVAGAMEDDRHRPPARLPEKCKNTDAVQNKAAVGGRPHTAGLGQELPAFGRPERIAVMAWSDAHDLTPARGWCVSAASTRPEICGEM